MGNLAVLAFDPDPRWRELKAPLSRLLGVELHQAATLDQAQEALKQHFCLAIFLADSLAPPGALRYTAEFKKEFPFLPVFLISTRPTVDGAVAAMRQGVQDYLSHPLTLEKLKLILTPLLSQAKEAASPRPAKPQDNGRARPVITQDQAMLQVLRLARAVAPTRAPVLIQGESGTGKEILARYLHHQSDRATGPFVAVNCAALPEGLLESELFGHEKGAFTGAVMRKLGKFELAQNGTLLLDEISEMHPHLQAKLLRVLQENEIDRVGGRHPIAINVRVIATTNQDIGGLIQQGGFREDLYYRLQVVSLHLPALRARRGDIPLLAEYFRERYSLLFNKGSLQFSAAALRALEHGPWPGNVRQLENSIARGVLLAEGNLIHPRDLLADAALEGGAPPAAAAPPGKPVTLRQMEQSLIYQALNETSGNRTHAAKLLGISVRTLRNKLHEYRQETLAGPARRSQVA